MTDSQKKQEVLECTAQDNNDDSFQREVVLMMTDMVGYSRATATMSPREIRIFLLEYHRAIIDIVENEESQPLSIESSAGDGSVIIFDKREGESASEVCNRAINVALKMSQAMGNGLLPPTRMGLILCDIMEMEVLGKRTKYGAGFSIANRLEELCGYFGCHFLMDRQIARKQTLFDSLLVNIGKVSIASMFHPMNIFTVYKAGAHGWPEDGSEDELKKFIYAKNQAMELFVGHQLQGILPDFPKVRNKLLNAQMLYVSQTGREDVAIAQVLKYIAEHPEPDKDFNIRGMRMLEKKRDFYGERILHMSCGFLQSLDEDLYHILIEDTEWEKDFFLEWRKKGEVIVKTGDVASGVYYIDNGFVEVTNEDGHPISRLGPGAVFGEIAYLNNKLKRTATVTAETDLVLRKITNDDLQKYPSIVRILEKIGNKRIDQGRQVDCINS